MAHGQTKYWGKIDAVDATRAESILEKGKREMPGQIPFVNITVKDAPELRTAREKVEKVIYVTHTLLR